MASPIGVHDDVLTFCDPIGCARLYRWHEHRGLPAHRVGRLWKFKPSEVGDWVRAGGADEGTETNKQRD